MGRTFVVGITEQRRHPGVQRRVQAVGALPGLRTSVAAVPDGGEVAVDLAVEALTDGKITATGEVRAPWTGECRRCLRAVEGELVAEVQEVFEPRPQPDAETYPLDGDLLDLEPMVRDAVLLALPLAPLCDDACAGPDPASHPVATGDEAEGEGEVDPRWSALGELRFEDVRKMGGGQDPEDLTKRRA